MIFYLKEKNKTIMELSINIKPDSICVTGFNVLVNKLPNIFENVTKENKDFSLFILNNFIQNRIFIKDRIIADNCMSCSVNFNLYVEDIDFKKSPHFANLLNNFQSFTDNYTIVPEKEFLIQSGHGPANYKVYNLKTSLITVERDDNIIYQEIVNDEKEKNKIIDFIKNIYDMDYCKDFFEIKEDATRRIGFKFKKDVEFISLSDLAIDYIPISLNENLNKLNKCSYISEKILKFYGEEAKNASIYSLFFNNLDLVFLLKKGNEFIPFSFF